MFDLEKLRDNNAIFWIFKFPQIREIAAECGWAIGVHGSVTHDLDLMAMPWVEEHATADELAKRIADEIDTFNRGYIKDEVSKPNNRVVYSIYAAGTYIDLNIIKTE